MPYEIRRKGNRYQVVNKDTGHVYSTTTREKAEKQLKLLEGIERDWTPTSDGHFSRKVNGQHYKLKIKSK
jgi:hypothetical protein